MVSFKHLFTSAKADGTNVTLVKPSNWNEEHKVETANDGIYLGRAAGAGPGPVQELPISSAMMVGSILIWPAPFEPTNWMYCEGQTLARATYPVLFSYIGGTYGAPDASTFSLPDLRGRVVAHRDPGWERLNDATVANPHLLNGQGGQQTEQAYADVNTSVSVGVNVDVYSNVSTSGRSYGATGGQQYFDSGDLGTSFVMAGSQTQQAANQGGMDLAGNAHSHWFRAYGWTQGQAGTCWADGTYYGGGSGSGSGSGTGSGTGGGWTRAITNVQPTLIMNFIIKVL